MDAAATDGLGACESPLGFEVVSDRLLDGHADRERGRIVGIGNAGDIHVISVEDIIADRVGQFVSGTAPDMLGQASLLHGLYFDLDSVNLERRIREETANEHGIDILLRA